MRLPILLAALLIFLTGCGARNDPPSEPPIGVTATPGDGVVLMSWDQLPDLIYWIFYRPGTSVQPADVGSIAIKNAQSPRVVAGLVNGVQYAFMMNASFKTSAAGPDSATVPAMPRLAGDSWIKGSTQGTQNLNALANGGTRFVTVGDGTTIFAGDFNYGRSNPVGVTQWLPPTTFPITVPPIAGDFKAVINNGIFFALASNGVLVSSGDGLNWIQQVSVPASGLNGFAFGFVQGVATYFAIGNGGQVFTSSDLQTWTPRSFGTSEDLTSIKVLNQFIIVTGTNGTLLVSPDGLNWTQQQVAGLPPGTTLRSAAFMPNALLAPAPPAPITYAVVGDGGVVVTATQILKDVNGIPSGDWAATVLPGAQNLRSVTVGGATGTRFLAVGQGGAAVFGDSVINNVPVSSINWLPAAQPPTGDFSSVFFFTGQYLAVGSAGANAVCH